MNDFWNVEITYRDGDVIALPVDFPTYHAAKTWAAWHVSAYRDDLRSVVLHGPANIHNVFFKRFKP